MSLDVYLRTTITCPHCHLVAGEGNEVYEANITHNLTRMAAEAGIYKPVWRPEEVGITEASQLVEPLTKGIELMKADPDRFKAHDSPNGWGIYDDFLPWLERYLQACIDNPKATISVSR